MAVKLTGAGGRVIVRQARVEEARAIASRIHTETGEVLEIEFLDSDLPNEVIGGQPVVEEVVSEDAPAKSKRSRKKG